MVGQLPNKSPVSRKTQPVLSDAIEELGVGPVQWRVAILCGLVSFSAGTEILVWSVVNDVLARDWHLGAFKSGALTSLVFVGIFLGTLLGGLAGDRFGRKMPIVAASWVIFVVCNLCLLSSGFWTLIVFLVILGGAFGFGMPSQITMVSETTPGHYRIAFTMVTIACFSLGEIYSSLLLMLDDAGLVHLHWRVMVAAAGAPSAAFGLLIGYFLYQSPVYLASRGQHEEAARILELMRRQNGLLSGSARLTLTSQPNSGGPTEVILSRQLEAICGPRLLSTTCITCYCALAMNLSYYGGLYAFPKILVSNADRGGNPAVSLMLGAVAELAGYFVGLLCIGFSRIQLMVVTFGIQGMCMGAFAFSASNDSGEDNGWMQQVLSQVGYHGSKVCSSVVFIVVYVYATEVYPTMARTLGGSFVAGSGRLGAILGPPAVECMFWIWDYDIFFWFAALLNAVALPLLLMLPYETKGKGLLDEHAGGAAPYGATGDDTGGA